LPVDDQDNAATSENAPAAKPGNSGVERRPIIIEGSLLPYWEGSLLPHWGGSDP